MIVLGASGREGGLSHEYENSRRDLPLICRSLGNLIIFHTLTKLYTSHYHTSMSYGLRGIAKYFTRYSTNHFQKEAKLIPITEYLII